MTNQKKRMLVRLVKTANELDMTSVLLLASNADALKAKERLDKKKEVRDMEVLKSG